MANMPRSLLKEVAFAGDAKGNAAHWRLRRKRLLYGPVIPSGPLSFAQSGQKKKQVAPLPSLPKPHRRRELNKTSIIFSRFVRCTSLSRCADLTLRGRPAMLRWWRRRYRCVKSRNG